MIDFIKDADCTKETPVRLGVPDAPIYGKGIKLKPRVDGRTDSEHFKKIYLPELLPLEEYDLIVVLISGGKDSVACYLKLLELGVPKERIEFWHHDIDGGHPSRRMDWKCTQNYVKALADAEGIKLRVSYRVNGFFGELYRIGASEPIEWIDPDTGEVKQCKLSSNYLKCKELKEQATEEMEELLKKYGYRMKFPAKTGDLSRRWCSAYLKICVADTVVSNLDRLGELEELGGKRHKFPAKGGTHSGRWCSGNLKAAVQDSVTANLEETKRDKKILIVSGERRGESAGRSKYNEMEIHRTNAEAKAHRIVHQWRCCIDYSEKDVWELLKRHHINPHPCYRIGWNRCSCMMCIFSTPRLFAGVKELFPDDYAALRHDEEVLGFTLDNKKNLDEFIGDTQSCVCWKDKAAIHAMKLRIPKVIAMIITAFAIGAATIIFQSVINNTIVTPCLLGMNALYTLIHTSVVFVLGSGSILFTNDNLSFLVDLVLMGIIATVVYSWLFKMTGHNVLYVLLVGTVLTSFFSSIQSTLTRVMDPNEYDTLLTSLVASFSNINSEIIIFSVIILALIGVIFRKELALLDVITLGKEQAINLGVDYDRCIRRLLLAVTLCIAVATAMVGPISFLGLIIANISRQLLKTYRHTQLIAGAALMGVIALIGGQFIVERVFVYSIPISVFITVAGGIYFLYLILKGSRHNS